jgi:hypothetical protein
VAAPLRPLFFNQISAAHMATMLTPSREPNMTYFKSAALAALGTLATLATPVIAAPTENQSVIIGVTTAPTATIALGGAPTANANNFVLSGNTVTIPTAEFADSTTSLFSGSGKLIEIPLNVMANKGGWRIRVKSLNGGMKVASPSAIIGGTFANRIDYSAVAAIANASPLILRSASLTTAGNPISSSFSSAVGINGAFASAGSATGNSNLTITLTDANVAAPLLAGTYTDTVTVTFEIQ